MRGGENIGGAIDLPWPPKELTPNFKRRRHWSAYQPKAKQYREDCAWIVKAWMMSEGVSALDGLSLNSVTFYPPDRRRRDDDGMIGAFKAGRDGVADALDTDDHDFRPNYNFGEPVKGGRIVVLLGIHKSPHGYSGPKPSERNRNEA